MKIKLKFCMLLIFLPCLMFGQVNKYISFGKKYVPAFNREINSVKVLCNDSLYNAKMKQYNREKGKEMFTSGYSEIVYFDFFKKASKFKILEGICYALNFELEKGESMDFEVDTFIIPKGTYLILSDTSGNIFKKFSSETKLKKFIEGKNFIFIGNPLKSSKSVILSIILPNNIPLENLKITFFEIGINIIQFFAQKDNDINLKNAVSAGETVRDKSATNTCNFNVRCMGNSGQWLNEFHSIVSLSTLYKISPSERLTVNGTAFFVINQDGYDPYKQPYLLTAGHLFYDCRTSQGYPFIKLISLPVIYSHVYGLIDAANCNDNYHDYSVLDSYSVIDLGNMLDVNDRKNDYALIQLEYTSTSNLISHYSDISFAGLNAKTQSWNDLDSLRPYRCFHVPQYDIFNKAAVKYSIYNYALYAPSGGTFYSAYSDTGFTTEGSSGAPVFNNAHQVIGILITGENSCDTPRNQPNAINRLSNIWSLSPTISSELGNTQYTFNHAYQNLPDHCKSCTYEPQLGERGVDCGGSCYHAPIHN